MNLSSKSRNCLFVIINEFDVFYDWRDARRAVPFWFGSRSKIENFHPFINYFKINLKLHTESIDLYETQIHLKQFR